jgi:hypothetical protein
MAGPVQDPMRAQQYRTQRAEMPEDLWQPLYDRVNYPAAGTSALGFFSSSRGQTATLLSTVTAGVWTAAAKVKTFRDTNIENSNVVPTKMFKVVGCSVGMLSANQNSTNVTRDREIIRGGSYLQFRIVDKDIIFLPLITIPEMNPVVSATANSVNGTAGGGGQNVPMYKFPIPITINPYENFTVQLNVDNSPPIDQTMDIYLMLHAYMRRPT